MRQRPKWLTIAADGANALRRPAWALEAVKAVARTWSRRARRWSNWLAGSSSAKGLHAARRAMRISQVCRPAAPRSGPCWAS